MFLSSFATVLGLTSMPISLSCPAILSVVRRVHFSPVIGSPAMSSFMISWIAAMTSGVFFPPPSDPLRCDGLGRPQRLC